MPRTPGDGGGPSGAARRHRRGPGASRAAERAWSLLLRWRARCAAGGVPLRTTARPEALDLCRQLVDTVEHRLPAPGLDSAARRWAERVGPGAEGALECLRQVAVEHVSGSSGGLVPAGLRRALELVAAEVRATRTGALSTPRAPSAPAALTRALGGPAWAGRAALEAELAVAMPQALAAGADLSVAVVEADVRNRGAMRGARRRASIAETALVELSLALGRALGPDAPVYRLDAGKLAVLAQGTSASEMGEAMLQVSVGSVHGPGFTWGAAGLRRAGEHVVADPGLLPAMAEADLHVRRRDLRRAREALARHRRQRVASVAAVLMLAAVVLAGVVGTGTGPAGHARSALRHPSTSQPAPSTPAPSAPAPAATVAPAAPSPSAAPPAAHLVSTTIPPSGALPRPPPSTTPPPSTAPANPLEKVVQQDMGQLNQAAAQDVQQVQALLAQEGLPVTEASGPGRFGRGDVGTERPGLGAVRSDHARAR